MTSGQTSELVSAAALLRVDVYPAGVTCDDSGLVSPGSPGALYSRSFGPGDPISLDVPPGLHTIALTAFADASATTPIGAGCVPDTTFQAGAEICINLSVTEVDASGSVCRSDDDCAPGEWCNNIGHCELGCSSSVQCAALAALVDGGGPQRPYCDPDKHACVECHSDGDCTGGKSCCDGSCVNTSSDPKNCSACGMACTGGTNTCCSGVCVNPATDVNNCNSCGKVCTLSNATAQCIASSCAVLACAPGRADCNNSPSNGCECETDPAKPACCGTGCQIKHDTGLAAGAGGGLKTSFFDCAALNTYNVTQATEACNTWIGGRAGWGCYDNQCGKPGHSAICAEVHDAMDNPVCTSEGSPCWGYAGTEEKGHVFLDPTCLNCPSATVGDPSWH
jgi:hypothetical protein